MRGASEGPDLEVEDSYYEFGYRNDTKEIGCQKSIFKLLHVLSSYVCCFYMCFIQTMLAKIKDTFDVMTIKSTKVKAL